MMADPLLRWLNREQAAIYLGCRVDHLPRLVKQGKLPRPSLHLGPKQPRYDRLALDAAMTGRAPSGVDEVVNAAAQQIRSGSL